MNSNCIVSFVKIVAVVTHDFLSWFDHPAHSVFVATVYKTLDTTRVTFLEGPLFCLLTVYPWLMQMILSTFVLYMSEVHLSVCAITSAYITNSMCQECLTSQQQILTTLTAASLCLPLCCFPAIHEPSSGSLIFHHNKLSFNLVY